MRTDSAEPSKALEAMRDMSIHSPSSFQAVQERGNGLIVNADDWGLNRETTDRTLDCIRCKSVSAVSAMVFMGDSERAAEISRTNQIDSGLHLNFTAHFHSTGTQTQLNGHQSKLAKYLRGNRFSQVVFNPLLMRSFDYVAKAQIEEFTRLYGHAPARLDGHHHMHLCANSLFGGLLPAATMVRKSFSFQPGEKSFVNRWYRNAVDSRLKMQHKLTDYFFSIQPLAPIGRLRKIVDLAGRFKVEMETHPQILEEHAFLTGDGFWNLGI